MPEKKVLTVAQFADELEVSHDTVSRWVKLGKIKGQKKSPFSKNSPILIPASELERVLKLKQQNQHGNS